MTATRREAIQLLERVPEDKLTYVVQILSSIDGLISISDRRIKKIDLDQFVTSDITVEEYLIYSE